jgi:hypothetical protein
MVSRLLPTQTSTFDSAPLLDDEYLGAHPSTSRPGGHPSHRVEMRGQPALVGGILGLSAAFVVVSVLDALWDSCDIGINADANSLTLHFLYAPAVAFSVGTASAAVYGIADRPDSGLSRTTGLAAAVIITLVLAGIALFVGSDFGADYPCPAAALSSSDFAAGDEHPATAIRNRSTAA